MPLTKLLLILAIQYVPIIALVVMQFILLYKQRLCYTQKQFVIQVASLAFFSLFAHRDWYLFREHGAFSIVEACFCYALMLLLMILFIIAFVHCIKNIHSRFLIFTIVIPVIYYLLVANFYEFGYIQKTVSVFHLLIALHGYCHHITPKSN